jgi:hypothetical protein
MLQTQEPVPAACPMARQIGRQDEDIALQLGPFRNRKPGPAPRGATEAHISRTRTSRGWPSPLG